MQLTVPKRTDADTESFPIEPEGVIKWLKQLAPLTSAADAREIYRGLRHSNRLNNDSNRRRSVIACFLPVLRDLHEHLLDSCRAQPLPLADEFQRNAQLLDGLLREEAFAFKILLSDSQSPDPDDARQAMQALAWQAEVCVHTYKKIPAALLSDANQLYSELRRYCLLDDELSNTKANTGALYRYILLQSLVDCRQHRVQQIAPLLHFFQKQATLLQLLEEQPKFNASALHYAIDLRYGARPTPSEFLLTSPPEQTTDEATAEHSQVLWVNAAPLLHALDQHIANVPSTATTLLGSESLERQSLVRFRVNLARVRDRRHSRAVCNEAWDVTIGHKAICAHLHFLAWQASNNSFLVSENTDNFDMLSNQVANLRPKVNIEFTAPQKDEMNQWVVYNHTVQGAALSNDQCHTGLAQVGELVALQSSDHWETQHNGKSSVLLGVVRWICSEKSNGIRMGVEYLARSVMPVGISRTDSNDIVAADALIIACKVKQSVLQTILLPALLYQPGDRLTATLGGKSRQLRLNQPLQNNGLFSHFSVLDDHTQVPGK